MKEMDERKQEGELHLLGGSTVYKQDYAPEVLEAFTNKHQGNDYWVRFNCPEFTSLCPITGQPDFATIHRLYPRRENGREQELEALLIQLPQPWGVS